MKLRCIVFTLGVFCSFLMSSSVEKFSITKKEDNRVSIAFSNEEIIISSKEGFDYITENKNSNFYANNLNFRRFSERKSLLH